MHLVIYLQTCRERNANKNAHIHYTRTQKCLKTFFALSHNFGKSIKAGSGPFCKIIWWCLRQETQNFQRKFLRNIENLIEQITQMLNFNFDRSLKPELSHTYDFWRITQKKCQFISKNILVTACSRFAVSRGH